MEGGDGGAEGCCSWVPLWETFASLATVSHGLGGREAVQVVALQALNLLGNQEPGGCHCAGELGWEEAPKSASLPAVSLLTFHLSQVFTEVGSLWYQWFHPFLWQDI